MLSLLVSWIRVLEELEALVVVGEEEVGDGEAFVGVEGENGGDWALLGEVMEHGEDEDAAMGGADDKGGRVAIEIGDLGGERLVLVEEVVGVLFLEADLEEGRKGNAVLFELAQVEVGVGDSESRACSEPVV